MNAAEGSPNAADQAVTVSSTRTGVLLSKHTVKNKRYSRVRPAYIPAATSKEIATVHEPRLVPKNPKLDILEHERALNAKS